MKIFLKREMIADSGEVDRLQSDLNNQSELVSRLFAELSGTERLYNSLNERIMELTNRLKNRAYPTREGERLHSDLARMRGTLTDYDKRVQSKRVEYDLAKKTLQQMLDNFDKKYLSVNIPEQK